MSDNSNNFVDSSHAVQRVQAFKSEVVRQADELKNFVFNINNPGQSQEARKELKAAREAIDKVEGWLNENTQARLGGRGR